MNNNVSRTALLLFFCFAVLPVMVGASEVGLLELEEHLANMSRTMSANKAAVAASAMVAPQVIAQAAAPQPPTTVAEQLSFKQFMSALRSKAWWKWFVRAVSAAGAISSAIIAWRVWHGIQTKAAYFKQEHRKSEERQAEMQAQQERSQQRQAILLKQQEESQQQQERITAQQLELMAQIKAHEKATAAAAKETQAKVVQEAGQTRKRVDAAQATLHAGQQELKQGQAKHAGAALAELNRLRAQSSKYLKEITQQQQLIDQRLGQQSRLIERAHQQQQEATEEQLVVARGTRMQALEKEILQTQQTVAQLTMGLEQSNAAIQQMEQHGQMDPSLAGGDPEIEGLLALQKQQAAQMRHGQQQLSQQLEFWSNRLQDLQNRKQELEQAATRIQSVARGFMARRRVKKMREERDVEQIKRLFSGLDVPGRAAPDNETDLERRLRMLKEPRRQEERVSPLRLGVRVGG